MQSNRSAIHWLTPPIPVVVDIGSSQAGTKNFLQICHTDGRDPNTKLSSSTHWQEARLEVEARFDPKHSEIQNPFIPNIC